MAAKGSFEATLETLVEGTPGLLGALLLSRQGDVIDVSLAQEARMRQLASFAVGLFELAERLSEDAGCGQTRELMVQCEDGNLFLFEVRSEELLLALGTRQAPAGATLHAISGYLSGLRARSEAGESGRRRAS